MFETLLEEEKKEETSDDIFWKAMSLDEFMQLGLLQEINRRFLHTMGLALSMSVNEESGKVEGFGPVWDMRHDTEGMRFTDSVILSDEARAKIKRVDELLESKKKAREATLGYHIQPATYVVPPKKVK